MIETTVKLYTFDELSQQAKEKARAWYREGLCYDSFYYDDVTEFWQDQILPGKGFLNTEISYSIGDYVYFSGDVDLLQYMKDNKLCNKYRLLFENIKTEWIEQYWKIFERYHTSCRVEYEACYMYIENDEKFDRAETMMLELFKEINQDIKDLCHHIGSELIETDSWIYSDENVDESILINEYTFMENGKRFG